jgi:chromosome segregation ATPase
MQKLCTNLEEETIRSKTLTESILQKENLIAGLTTQNNHHLNEKAKFEKQLSFANNKISSLKECLHKENELVKDYQAKTISRNGSLSQLQDLNQSLNGLIDDLKAQNLKLAEDKSCLQGQITVFKNNVLNKDLVIAEQVRLVESLQEENKSQRDRIGMIKAQYDQFVSDSQKIIDKSKNDYVELNEKYAKEQAQRINLENIKSTMTRLVMELESASKKESAERRRLDQLLEDANHKIGLLEAKFSDHSNYSSELTLDSTGIQTPHKIPRKSRLSFKQLFKSPGSLTSVSKSLASVQSVESGIDHLRCRSIDTCGKSQISLGKEH